MRTMRVTHERYNWRIRVSHITETYAANSPIHFSSLQIPCIRRYTRKRQLHIPKEFFFVRLQTAQVMVCFFERTD